MLESFFIYNIHRMVHIQTITNKYFADTVTPVGIYLRLRDRFRDTVLLESMDASNAEKSWTYIGVNAIAGFEVVNNTTIEYKYPNQPAEKITINKPSQMVDELIKYLSKFKANDDAIIKEAQSFIGYTAYDAIQFFDSISLSAKTYDDKTPTAKKNPLIRYRLYQYVIAINHYKQEMFICENQIKGIESEIEVIRSFIQSKDVPSYPFAVKDIETSNLTDAQYIANVKTGIQECLRGNVFQVVLSRRFQQSYTGDDFNVYRALRSINPSPYLFYFDYGDYRLFGSSPEAQLVVKDQKAVIHPIAGTFKRTGDAQIDAQKAQELLQDPKENAEHVMLVDLARNDLSKDATEVTVDSYKQIHYYSHVIHLVSEVSGKIANGTHSFNVMANTFPAGTLSGAPKFKAMQIIDKLEPTSRGHYGGAIGLLGLNGEFNHAIMIRTFLSKNNTLYYQAGAGVVAKSNPESELQEVNNKLGALTKAIQLANETFSY